MRLQSSRTTLRSAVLLAGALLSIGHALGAQDTLSASHRFCMRANLATGCDWFPITEVGTAMASGYPDWSVMWQVGVVHQLNPRYALGLTVAQTYDDIGSATTVAPRGRVYFNKVVALDVAPGAAFREGASGASLDISLGFGDWASVYWRTTTGIRAGNGIGLKAGSYPGMILGLVSVVLFSIARSDAGS